jgi:putative transposase
MFLLLGNNGKQPLYCQQYKGLILNAWVIMTNHVHLILGTRANKIESLARDMKKGASKKIISEIQENA